MAYLEDYNSDINKIIELIKLNRLEGTGNALEEFIKYLDAIENIGTFDLANWKTEWRESIHRLGDQFDTRNITYKRSPYKFIDILDLIPNSCLWAISTIYPKIVQSAG